MTIWEVTYGDGLKVFLRDPHGDGTPWLRGTECDENGIAHRDGCQDAEFVVRVSGILNVRRREVV